VLKLPVYDTQCGAKLFRNTDRTRSLFAEPFRTRWIFDVELLARFVSAATAAGQAPAELIHELPLQSWRDVAGSKLRPGDFLQAAVQLAGIAWHYRVKPNRAVPAAVGPTAPADPVPSSAASQSAKVPASQLESVS
jgi:hypothetical protein